MGTATASGSGIDAKREWRRAGIGGGEEGEKGEEEEEEAVGAHHVSAAPVVFGRLFSRSNFHEAGSSILFPILSKVNISKVDIFVFSEVLKQKRFNPKVLVQILYPECIYNVVCTC